MSRPSSRELKSWLPPRPAAAHKGTFGHALIVAGSRGMTGAAILAARGALRAGCGLATVALPASQQPIVAAAVPEALTLPLPETSAGAVRADAAGTLKASHESRRYAVLAVGPGLGLGEEAARAVVGLLAGLPVPAVVDADALNLLARGPREEVRLLLKRRKAPFVITPHPGEAARLLGGPVAASAAGREAAARRLAGELGCVCLLKGRGTVVTDGRRVRVNPTGNAGLAKGGTGDALTGILAGLWAQRAASGTDAAFEPAVLAAWLHGAAADRAAREKTERCLLASDVIEALPAAFRRLGK